MLFHAYKNCVSRYVRTKPTNIVLLVTDRCNAQCIMCSIWKEGFSSGVEMSVHQYDELLQAPFFHDVVNVMISGGEALLRKDIEQLLAVILARLPRLRRITIATNGLATELIEDKMLKIISLVEGSPKHVQLVCQVSVDAVSEVHDYIRAPEAGIKVKKTLIKLMGIRNSHPLFKISAGCVIQPKNIDEIEDVFDYLMRNAIDSIFTVICIDDHYYGNSDSNELIFNDSQKSRVQALLEKISGKEKNIGKKFLYRQFSTMLAGGKNIRGCPALRDTVTLGPAGDVFPCLNSCASKMGNVLTEDIHDIWFSASAQETCRMIADQKCADCMFACGVSYFEVLKYALRSIGRRRVS